MYENTPDLWLSFLPRRGGTAHKYGYGHAVIYGAPVLTGASRLAAESCARIGSGLTTVLCTPETAVLYRTALPAHIMVRDDLNWTDERVSAKLYGPGGLPSAPDYDRSVKTVLDADALLNLPDRLNENFVLTPHEGEFSKAFPGLEGSRVERAKAASEKTGAVIVLKGADTVIAGPDGRCVVNTHASPALATAGSGDVLAGMITGLLAQGMAPFEASCAAVWIHGECALTFGSGLVASDLPDLIPAALQDLT
ncbi:MAG: NAD(P)H-hydrate dehydratase [Alphaproteobacteria bacterium]|nr:NAD(P)H-hydrate dehydratase [Alphaproteobacteria bacterium]